MNSFAVLKVSISAVVLAALCGCAGVPKTPPDRTPSWMKYQVVGSRIHRNIDVSGQPDSAHYVVSVEAAELRRLPGAKIVNRRR